MKRGHYDNGGEPLKAQSMKIYEEMNRICAQLQASLVVF